MSGGNVSETQQQLIRMIEHCDEKEPPERTIFQQVSLPPHRFSLALLVGLVWFLLGLVLAPLIVVPLANPWIYVSAGHPQLIYYAFQLPAVILVAAVLGRQYGLLVIFAYLALGLAGFPIFSGGGGWHYVQELSAGYLFGFLLVPFAMHRLLRHGLRGGQDGWFQGRSVFIVLAAVAGVLVVHLCGLLGFAIHGLLGWQEWPVLMQWAYVFTVSRIPYDLLFGTIAVTLVRFVRLLLSLALY